MAWVEVFSILVVCHLVGDYLVQTDWQATNKRGGLGGDPTARRALAAHVVSYTLAFVPAFVWLAGDLGAELLAVVALVAIPHWIQDDGRLLRSYIAKVKGVGAAQIPSVYASVDQTLHILTLLGVAFLAGS